jgi:hypothetical protein
MAGAILFLPARRVAPVGGSALCGVESGARRDGEDGASVEMVERGCPLWRGQPTFYARDGALEESVTEAQWRDFLAQGESAAEVSALRICTHTGRPLGSPEFVTALEQLTLRPLAPRKGGRPKKPATDSRQLSLAAVA